MTKRPRSLIFAVDERPNNASLAVLALQHAALSAVFLVYAAVVAKGAGFNLVQQQAMVVGTLLSCGIGAMIQVSRDTQFYELTRHPVLRGSCKRKLLPAGALTPRSQSAPAKGSGMPGVMVSF